MTTPQTPRRSNRQQKRPARYGGGILIPTSQTYKWPAHPIHTRPTQPSDLLPDEAFEPGETQFYSSLIKYGLPSRPIVRTYGKQKSAKAVASGSRTSEAFSVGDTVLVASTARTTSIAVITALWRVVREDDEAGDDEDPDESMRIRVHWFTRPAQLGGSRQKRDSLPVSSLSAYFGIVDQTTRL
jgi:origin recognition complex subunit 1